MRKSTFSSRIPPGKFSFFGSQELKIRGRFRKESGPAPRISVSWPTTSPGEGFLFGQLSRPGELSLSFPARRPARMTFGYVFGYSPAACISWKAYCKSGIFERSEPASK